MPGKQVLVCNCGSSSVKIDVFTAEKSPVLLATASVERLNETNAHATFRSDGRDKIDAQLSNPGYTGAIRWVAEKLATSGLFAAEGRLAIGHRVVHGGANFSSTVLIDKENLRRIEECIPLAPLHNPPNLEGIRVLMELYPVPQYAVFDTAFHTTLPDYAKTYAMPVALAEKYGIHRYGFHGMSHHYVAGQAAEKLGKKLADVNLVTLHLGNGCSACAVRGGTSVDTSMGFTPLEGLVMGTRSGDLDPAIVAFLARHENLSAEAVDHMLSHDSGLKGLAGVGDMREIVSRAATGDAAADLALGVFCYRVKKYIGAYAAVLGRVDAIVFTGGIGENSALVREKCVAGLPFDVPILVINTDEQRYIAAAVANLLK